MINKIGLGGGCHWCTEGVFQSLIGIVSVQQGWISSFNENESLSEAVLIEFDNSIISMKELIEIHLYTHACTSDHSFRKKYRSAVYVFDINQQELCKSLIDSLQENFYNKIITTALLFNGFKLNKKDYLNYLYRRKNNSFCENYIHPKLTLLLSKFSDKVNHQKIKDLTDANIKF